MATIISTKTSGVGGLSVTGDASGVLQLASADGTTAVTIDASQNVGIGTSSPTGRISVVGSDAGSLARIDASNGTVKCEMIPYSGLGYYGTTTSHPVVIQTAGTEKMRIDSSGNVGIGVVPNVWSVGKAIEIGSAGNSILGAGAGNFQLYSNLYYNGGAKFATAASTFGSSFQMVNSSTYSYFAFNTTSVAGTAGNTATVLERVRIDSSGNVGIGTSSPSYTAVGRGNLNIGGTIGGILGFQVGGVAKGYIFRSPSDMQMWCEDAVPLVFGNNALERMRIDSTGQQSSTIVGFSGTYNEYKCRAWVNFNGTGTVAIRASGNVSSITDTGVGGYTVNFTTAMPDANYAVTGLCSDISVNGAMVNTTTLSTSGVTIATRVPAAYLGSDQALITIAINR